MSILTVAEISDKYGYTTIISIIVIYCFATLSEGQNKDTALLEGSDSSEIIAAKNRDERFDTYGDQ